MSLGLPVSPLILLDCYKIFLIFIPGPINIDFIKGSQAFKPYNLVKIKKKKKLKSDVNALKLTFQQMVD